jgi:hypothetical protein
MKTTLAIGTLLGLLSLATSAGGSSLAELSGTMATGNALSAGAASGASTAHAAMQAAIRNLPKAGSGLEGIDNPASAAPRLHGGAGSGGWAKPGTSAGGRSGWSVCKAGGPGGWATPSSGGGKAGWVRRATASQRGAANSTWARAGDPNSRRR